MNASGTENSFPALIEHTETVKPEWIDFNGHMNVAYYVLVFDHAADALLNHLGLGVAYVRRDHGSLFVVEVHVNYLREVGEGDRLRITSRLLDFDHKRLHIFHHMYLDGGGASGQSPVATMETMLVHVDLDKRRSSPIPAAALERVRRLAEAQAHLPSPSQAGGVVGLKTG